MFPFHKALHDRDLHGLLRLPEFWEDKAENDAVVSQLCVELLQTLEAEVGVVKGENTHPRDESLFLVVCAMIARIAKWCGEMTCSITKRPWFQAVGKIIQHLTR